MQEWFSWTISTSCLHRHSKYKFSFFRCLWVCRKMERPGLWRQYEWPTQHNISGYQWWCLWPSLRQLHHCDDRGRQCICQSSFDVSLHGAEGMRNSYFYKNLTYSQTWRQYNARKLIWFTELIYVSGYSTLPGEYEHDCIFFFHLQYNESARTDVGTTGTSRGTLVAGNVKCELPKAAPYLVALSNDGVTTSSAYNYLVYSPKCETCNITTGTCKPVVRT